MAPPPPPLPRPRPSVSPAASAPASPALDFSSQAQAVDAAPLDFSARAEPAYSGVESAAYNVIEAGKQFPTGVAQGFGSSLRGLAAIPQAPDVEAKWTDKIMSIPQLDDAGVELLHQQIEADTSIDREIKDNLHRNVEDVRDGIMPPEEFAKIYGPQQNVQDRQIYKVGKWIGDNARVPVRPGFEGGPGAVIGEGLGSMVGGALATAAGTAIGGPIGGAIAGGATFASQGMGEAADRAIAAGASQEDIGKAALLGIVPGATDILPVEAALALLRVPAPFRRVIASKIAKIGGQAIIEGLQEGGQQFLQNLIGREVYNPDQSLGEGIGENAAGGAGVGAVYQTLLETLLPGKVHAPPAPAPGAPSIAPTTGRVPPLPPGTAVPAAAPTAPTTPPRTPPRPSTAPPLAPAADEVAVLQAAGWSTEDIADMDPTERADAIAEAQAQGVVPPTPSPRPEMQAQPESPGGAVTQPSADAASGAPDAAREKENAELRRVGWHSPDTMTPDQRAAALAAIAAGAKARGGAAPSIAPDPTDTPSAEPRSDVLAQMRDMDTPDSGRQGVWLPAATVQHLENTGGLPPEIANHPGKVENFDGRGGMLIAGHPVTQREAVAARDAGADIQAIVGLITGIGSGKPANPEALVQQTDAKGNVTRETLTHPGTTRQVVEALQAAGKTAAAVPIEQALTTRAEKVAAEAQAQPQGLKEATDGLRNLFQPPAASEAPTASPPMDGPEISTGRVRGRPARGGPRGILTFLGSIGGVRPNADFAAMGADKHFVPGTGKIVRQSGMDADKAREAAAEAGYFNAKYGTPYRATAESTVDDLIEAVAAAMRGEAVLSPDEQVDAEAKGERDARERAADRAVSDAVIDYGLDADYELEVAAIRLMTDNPGMTPEDAIEQAAMRLTYESTTPAERAPVEDAIPGFFEEVRDEAQPTGLPEGRPGVRAAEGVSATGPPEAAGDGGAADAQPSEDQGAAKGVSGFTTAKGSTYVVHEDGTTTRDKAARNDPGHEGDSGPKKRSDKTAYLTQEQANALATPQGEWRIADLAPGGWALALLTPNKQAASGWGVVRSSDQVPFQATPAAGLIPLELWQAEKIGGATAYKAAHFGNPITEVRKREGNVDSAPATQGHLRPEPLPAAAGAFEQTPAGEQAVIPGAEQIGQGEQAKLGAKKPLRPKVAQQPADEGLFGDSAAQTDLVDMAKKPPAGSAQLASGISVDDAAARAKFRAGLNGDPGIAEHGGKRYRIVPISVKGAEPGWSVRISDNATATTVTRGGVAHQGLWSRAKAVQAAFEEAFGNDVSDVPAGGSVAGGDDTPGTAPAGGTGRSGGKRQDQAGERGDSGPGAEGSGGAVEPSAGPRDVRNDRLAPLVDRLIGGEPFATIIQARQFAAAHGITGDRKEIDETIEAAVVLAARDIVKASKARGPLATYKRLVGLYDRQPRLAVRTAQSMTDQAYSTPAPLAYIASQAAGVAGAKSVLEPTAGNGMLLIEATPKKAKVNEINQERRKALLAQGFTVTGEDASAKVPFGEVDAVIMNPPFGAVRENGESKVFTVGDYKTTQIDQAIALRQLAALKDDGRAVLIVGGVKGEAQEDRAEGYRSQNKRKFYKQLYDTYNVVDHYTVSGDLYAKQGAEWPVDVIVIEGRGKSKRSLPAADVPRLFNSWAALEEKINGSGAENESAGSGVGQGSAAAVDAPGSVPGPNGGDAGRGPATVRGRPVGGERPGGANKPLAVQSERPGEQPTDARPLPGDRAGVEPGGVRDGGRPAEQPDRGPSGVEEDFDAIFAAALDEQFGPAPKPAAVEKPADAPLPAGYEADPAEAVVHPSEQRQNGGKWSVVVRRLARVATTGEDVPISSARGYGDTPEAARADAIRRIKPAVGQRSAGEAAASAVKNTAAGLDQAMAGLSALFGGGKTLGVGLNFDEETYRQAVPHFKMAISHFKTAGADTAAMVKAMINHFATVGNFSREAIGAMLPYVRRFIDDVRSGAITLDEDTAPTPKAPKQKDAPSKGQSPYDPRSTNVTAMGTLVPTNMVDAIQGALEAVEIIRGPLSKYVATELGYEHDADGPYFMRGKEKERPFLAEQVDAVALAIDNIARGGAMILGDQTGIGKGRVVAGLIRWARRNGRLPVFITEAPDLYGDMYRDLGDIGELRNTADGEEIRIFATNVGENIPLDEEALDWKDRADEAKLAKTRIPPREGRFLSTGDGEAQEAALLKIANGEDIADVVFTTYKQLQTVEGEETTRRRVIRQLASRSIFLLDEAHNAGGQEVKRPKAGAPQKMADMMRQVLQSSPGVLYSSATYAKRPQTMTLYNRTDMSKAVDDPKELPDLITKGGVPLQQIVAAMLARAGQYLRRERSFEGVSYGIQETPVDEEIYSTFTGALRAVYDFDKAFSDERKKLVQEVLDEAGAAQAADPGIGETAANSTEFASIMHNLIGQMILAIKADKAADRAILALREGRKPILTLANTMESFLSDYIENSRTSPPAAHPPPSPSPIVGHILRAALTDGATWRGGGNAITKILTAIKAGATFNDASRPHAAELFALMGDRSKFPDRIPTGEDFEAAAKYHAEMVASQSQPATEAAGFKVGDDINITFKDVLRRYLERTLRITVKDSEGNKSYIHIPVTKISPPLQAMYAQAEAAIDEGGFEGLPVSPIDWMRNRITKAGYSIAEVTGRDMMIDYGNGNSMKLAIRPRSEKGPAGKRSTIGKFNRGDLDAVILNAAGSTGVSLHAGAKFKDQRQRRMLIVQANPNIDVHMQTLGRIHRTGQVVLPEYEQIVAMIPAEARPISVLLKKMASLNANTTASRSSLFSSAGTDFMNKYGDQIAVQILRDDPWLNARLGFPIRFDDKGKPVGEDPIRKLTGRITLLMPAEQRELLERLEADYAALITRLDAMGLNALEAKTLDLEAQTIEHTEMREARGRSPFEQAAGFDKVSAKAQGRAMAPKEVVEAVAKALDASTTPNIPLDQQLRRLAPIGRANIQKRVAALHDLWSRWLPGELANYKDDATKTRQRAKHEMLFARLRMVTDVTYPGAHVILEEGDNRTQAIVLDVKRGGKAKNPAAPSAFEVQFAVPSSHRTLSVPMSQLFTAGIPKDDDDAGLTVSPAGWADDLRNLVNMFEEARKEGREERYILTGNILAGFDLAGGGGQVVNYTTEAGEQRPGILMPRDFDLGKFMNSRPVRLMTGEQIRQFLERSTMGEITSTDSFATIRSTGGGFFDVQHPAGRATGGRYFTEPSVRAAVGDNYERFGKWMRTRNSIPAARAVAAAEAMIRLGATFETRKDQDIALAVLQGDSGPDGPGPSGGGGRKVGNTTADIRSQLETSLGKPEFGGVFMRVQAMPTAEIIAIARDFTQYRAKTKAEALQRINARNENILTALAKQAATGGRSAGNTGLAPVFYSAVLRAAEGAKIAKGTADQWLGPREERTYTDPKTGREVTEVKYGGAIGNTPGVKPEEIEWLGLEAWLKAQPRIITREEVADFIRANQLSVQEVVKKGMGDEPSPAQRAAVLRWAREADDAMLTPAEDETSLGGAVADALARIDDGYIAAGVGSLEELGIPDALLEPYRDYAGGEEGPKFGGYQLPGGENYRELLLTLPAAPSTYKIGQDKGLFWRIVRPDGTYAGLPMETRADAEAQLPAYSKVGDKENYRSPHWDEPNVIAHVRFTERTITEPWTDEDRATIARRAEISAKLAGMRAREGEIVRAIKAEAAPRNAQVRAEVLADVKAGRIKAFRMAEEEMDRIEALGPLPSTARLLALRDEEDALRRSMPPEPTPRTRTVLFIEEIQSDWHQAGRKQGYQGGSIDLPPLPEGARRDQRSTTQATLYVPFQNRELSFAVAWSPQGGLDWAAAEQEARRLIAGGGRPGTAVPDAPFKTTWPELAFKRAVRWAAEKGFDAVAWTPGDVQNERYETVYRQEVRSIEWSKSGAGMAVGIDGVRGVINLTTDLRGVVTHADRISREAVGKTLEDLLGKDTARTIIEGGPSGRIEQEGLMIGGEGMRGFYDKILPGIAGKIGKKHGAEVSRIDMAEGRNKGGVSGAEVMTAMGIPAAQQDAYWRDLQAGERTRLIEEFRERGKVHKVWSLPITDRLRAAAMGGQPMFNAGVWNTAAREAVNEAPRVKLDPRQTEALRNNIQSIISRIAGRRVVVRFVDTLSNKDAMDPQSYAEMQAYAASVGAPLLETSGGSINIDEVNGTAVITIALNDANYNPRSVSGHEAWHFVEFMLLNDAERAMLKRELPRMRAYAAAELGATAEEVAAMPDYEVSAVAFQRYRRLAAEGVDPMAAGGLHIAIRRAFAKVLNALDTIKRMLLRQGYRKFEDIFQAAEAGKFADRAPTPANDNPSAAASVLPTIFRQRANRALLRVGDQADRIRVKMQDKALPIRRLQEAIEEQTGTSLAQGVDVYMADTLYSGRAGERLIDLKVKHLEPLIEDMRRRKVTREQLDEYLYARHAPERNAVIVQRDPTNTEGSGMSDGEAAAIMSRIAAEGRMADMQALAVRVDALRDESLATLVRGGLLSSEQRDEWMATYPNYVPLRGWETDDDSEASVRIGRGYNVRGPESRTAMGRHSVSDSPLAYLLMQADQAVIRAEKNRVMKTLKRLVEAHPNPDLWKIFKGEYRQRINDKTGMIERHFVPPPFVNADNLFAGKVGGKAFYIQINNEQLARSLRGVTSEIYGNPVMRALMKVSRFYAGLQTQFSPEFILTNFVRDLEAAAMNISDVDGGAPKGARLRLLKDAVMLKSVRAAFHALRNPTAPGSAEYVRYFEEYRLAGGKVSFMELNDVGTIKRDIEKRFSQGRPKTALKAAGKLVSDLNTAVENGARLSAYIALRKAGTSQNKAAAIAKELTVNFNRHGEIGPIINSAYVFYNAAIQGSFRLARAASRSKTVRYALLAILAAGFGLDWLNDLIGGKAYSDIPDWVKERNIIIMTGSEAGDYVMIPMAYGYNAPWVIGTQMGHMIRGARTPAEAIGASASAIIDAFNPLGSTGSLSQFLSPTLTDPIIQVAENKTWYGGPIYPMKFDRRQPDSENYFDTAPWWAKGVSRILNEAGGGNVGRPGSILGVETSISPDVIQHYAEFLTGGAGKFVINSFNTADAALHGRETPPEDIPFVRRFFGSESAGPALARHFYDAWQEVDGARYEMRELAQEGDRAGARAARAENLATIRLYGMFNAATQQLSDMRDLRHRLEGEAQTEETKKRIADLIEREQALMLKALEAYNARDGE